MRTQRKRKAIYSLNLIVLIFAMLAVLGLVNWLGTKHYKRWDLAKPVGEVLSAQTINLLKSLDKDIKVTYLYTYSPYEEEEKSREDWKELLERYKALSNHFDYEMIDFAKNPARAERFIETTKIAPDPNSSILQYGAYEEKLSDKTEAALTGAMVKVTRGEVRTVCFTEGHGEHDPGASGAGGYNMARTGLEQENFKTEQINVMMKGVPETCSIVVVGGPAVPFKPEEAALLEKWLDKGGKMMVMLDPIGVTGLESMLDKYGIIAEDDLLKTEEIAAMGVDPLFVFAETYNPTHPITQLSNPLVLVGDRIGNMPSYFFEARSIRVKDEIGSDIDADTLVTSTDNVKILSSSESPMATRNNSIQPENKVVDAGVAIGEVGPQVLAAYATKVIETEAPKTTGEEQIENKSKLSVRLVVFGDSDFAGDGFIEQGANADIFLNSFAWLAEEEASIGIRPKKNKLVPIHFAGMNNWLILMGVIFIVPLVVLINGLLVWLERKKL